MHTQNEETERKVKIKNAKDDDNNNNRGKIR